MLPIINRHINKRNGLVSTLFRTIQTSAHQETPTATVLHWASSQDLDDQKKFQDHIQTIVENENTVKRIAENENTMKKVYQMVKKVQRFDNFNSEVMFKIHQIETYLDKERAVFGWAQILSSLEAAVVLFLNTNISKSYRVNSLAQLAGRLKASQSDEMEYKKIVSTINTIESVLGVSCNSLVFLIQRLNQLERNPAAHRALSRRKDVKEATKILVAQDSSTLQPPNPRIYASHMMKNPHNCPILEESHRDTLKRLDRVYEEMWCLIPSFCVFFDLNEEEFEAEYECTRRDLKVTQTKLFAFWIDINLSEKQMTKEVIEIATLAKEPQYFKDIKLPKGTQEE